jgi:hypothetical protein
MNRLPFLYPSGKSNVSESVVVEKLLVGAINCKPFGPRMTYIKLLLLALKRTWRVLVNKLTNIWLP